MNDHTSEIIDEFLREKFGEESFGTWKTLFKVAFMVGRLDVAKFAKDAGVTENEVRLYFGGEPASEPEEADEPDNSDETEAAAPDATQILSQQIDLLERDSNSILERAERECNSGVAYSVDQLYALNRQLNVLTRMFAIHARNALKERED